MLVSKQLMVATDFHSMFSILSNGYYQLFGYKNKFKQVWKKLDLNDDNFHFWLNYSFK